MVPRSDGRRVPALRVGALAAGLLLIGGMLSGCYEDTDVTVQEPGVYKGKPDPLLEKMQTASLQGELDDRFRSGQMDR